MFYYKNIIKGLFPEAEECEEDEEKLTIIFRLKKREKVAGEIAVLLSKETRDVLDKHFDPDWSFKVVGAVNKKGYGSPEIVLIVTLSKLQFVKIPEL